MKTQEKTIIILMIVCIGIIVSGLGCAGWQINLDTSEKKYLAVQEEFNLLMETYIRYQNDVPNKDHEKVKDALIKTSAALDVWHIMLKNKDYNYTEDFRTWLETKRLIMEVLNALQSNGKVVL